MNKTRHELIKEISEERGSKVICYICGDRQNVNIRVAPDIIPVFYKLLENIKPTDKIDLFIFTKGGDVLTALRLVELIYEYCNNFSVLVPYKSYSAGTLICLGASEVVMTKMAELSPVDPNITSVFNPEDNNNVKLPINVEDVYSFFSIAKNVVGLKTDDALIKVFTNLTEHIHPLAVGSIFRTHALIRSVARQLLLMHMDYTEEFKINEIVNTLTEKLQSHSYMITRREAKEITRIPVKYPSSNLEKNMWELYEAYERDFLFNTPFSPEEISNSSGEFSVCSGVIENLDECYCYMFDGIVQYIGKNNINTYPNINIINQNWRKM
jgi:hypothetical protein